MSRITRLLVILLLALLAVACSTIEIRIETPYAPDQDAVSTLASLMIEGTQYAQILTAREGTPDPVLSSNSQALVRGEICYPGQRTPAMLVFFRDLVSDQVVELPVGEYQDNFSLELPAGTYYAYAWVPQYQVGGIYSEKVLCGDSVECADHSPARITLEPGQSLDHIDICDWSFTAENLPLPAGRTLP